MPTTPRSLGLVNRINRFSGQPEEAWYELRSMRSGPPGAAAKEERRAVFCAALAQAQELLEAAATVSNAVRPLPLFYGLSQAGRAIAACAINLDDHEWRLTGHGLSAGQSVRKEHLADVSLKPQQPTGRSAPAFYMLQKALDSPAWTKPARLGAVWAAIPNDLQLLPHMEGDIPAVRLVPYTEGPFADGNSVSVSGGEITLGVGSFPPTLLPEGSEEHDVAALLSQHFPGWTRTEPISPPPGSTGLRPIRRNQDGSVFLTRRLLLGNGKSDWLRLAASLGVDYPADKVIPVTGKAGGASHPFILWWALLFGLSMRARYEPEGWTRDLAVDENSATVRLEDALRQALRLIPGLIVRAIDEVSAGSE